MASLRKKDRSPYWFACFTMPDGSRTQRSTKETSRKAAQAVADEWERLAKSKLKARHLHGVLRDIYRAAHGQDLPDSTPRTYISGWLERRKGEVADSTLVGYTSRLKHFTEWLGDRADGMLSDIDTRDIVSYRDALAASCAPATVNHAIQVLRVIFEDARRDKLVADNPAHDCPPLKVANTQQRRPFTVDELRRVIDAANDEWRSLVLFGIYTGQRLGDLARLTWQNIDLQAGEVALVTRKTQRRVRIPICGPLMAHIETLPAGDNPAAPLHPQALAKIGTRNDSVTGLSRQFAELLASIGLVEPARRSQKGVKVTRKMNALSFHSLRHTATSLLKNAGVTPAIVQDIIGHDSPEVSAHYTVIDSAAKAQALASLPDLTSASRKR